MVGLDIDEAALAEIASPAGLLATAVADIADEDALADAVAEAIATLGGLDVLVNCAALFPMGGLATSTVDVLSALNTNTVGGIRAIRHSLPRAARLRGGRIINFTSVVVHMGGPPELGAYVTTKAAIIGATRALARELGPDGITVNAIAPGSFPTRAETSTIVENREEFAQQVIAQQSIKRRGEVQDIAPARHSSSPRRRPRSSPARRSSSTAASTLRMMPPLGPPLNRGAGGRFALRAPIAPPSGARRERPRDRARPDRATGSPLPGARTDRRSHSPSSTTRARRASIARDPRTGGYLVFGHAEIAAVLSDPQTFTTEPADGSGGPLAYRRAPMLGHVDGALHTELRTFFSRSLTPGRVRAWHDDIATIVDDLIDAFASDGEVEFVSAFAAPLPARVLCRLIGIAEGGTWKLHPALDRGADRGR